MSSGATSSASSNNLSSEDGDGDTTMSDDATMSTTNRSMTNTTQDLDRSSSFMEMMCWQYDEVAAQQDEVEVLPHRVSRPL